MWKLIFLCTDPCVYSTPCVFECCQLQLLYVHGKQPQSILPFTRLISEIGTNGSNLDFPFDSIRIMEDSSLVRNSPPLEQGEKVLQDIQRTMWNPDCQSVILPYCCMCSIPSNIFTALRCGAVFQPSLFKVLVHALWIHWFIAYSHGVIVGLPVMFPHLLLSAHLIIHRSIFPTKMLPRQGLIQSSASVTQIECRKSTTFIDLGVSSYVELHLWKNRMGEWWVLKAIANKTSAVLCYLLCFINDYSDRFGCRLDVAPVIYFF